MTFEEYRVKKEKDFGEWAKNDVKSFLKKDEKVSFEDWSKDLRANAEYYSLERINLVAKNTGITLTPEQAQEIRALYFIKLETSYKVQLAKFEKAKKVVEKYQPLIDEAQKLVDSIDLSDLNDGFPCGSAFVYLELTHELGQALRQLKGGNGRSHWSEKIFDAQFPVRYNHNCQCIDFDRRLSDRLECFLRDKGLPAKTYSYID